MATHLSKPSEGSNRNITQEQMEKIRKLDDFDLIMLISEIHDHGWMAARKTLAMMPRGKRDDGGSGTV
jgi:hypothetical protein